MRGMHRRHPVGPGNHLLLVLGLALLVGPALVLPDRAAAGTGGVTIVTQVHGDDDEVIKSVEVGDTLHPWVSVSGLMSVPTGSVTTRLYAGPDCSGSTLRTWLWQLGGGVAHVASESKRIEGVGSYSMRSLYGGNALYASKTGPCVGFSGDRRPAEYYVDVRDAAGQRIDAVVAGEPVVVDVVIVGDLDLPDPTGEVFLHYWKGSCPGSGLTTEAKPLVDGRADFELVLDVPGETRIAAIYGGDSLYREGHSGCDEPVAVTKATATVMTAIHDGGHQAVTSVPLGASVHAWISLTGAATVPTGRVNVDWFSDATCSGVASTAYTDLVGGEVDLEARALEGDVAGTHAFRATYFGDVVYVSAVGPCTTYTIRAETPTSSPAGATMVPATHDPGSPPESPHPSVDDGPPSLLPSEAEAPSSAGPELGPTAPATRSEPPLWLLLVIALGMVVLGYVAGQRRRPRKEVTS